MPKNQLSSDQIKDRMNNIGQGLQIRASQMYQYTYTNSKKILNVAVTM